MLENIKHPSDVRELDGKETEALADEIRETIIKTVADRGGHLASNLGMVEATIALHRVYDCPSDSIVFDVGHQCYAHKLLTGRYESFHTLRTYGGISGFVNREESEFDVLSEGHSGASISAALGIATANKLEGNGKCIVAVIGDGSLTNGMVYEALNNCASKELDLVILINDNQMSISSNVGGLHEYLSRIRTSNGYFTFKRRFEHFLSAIPLIGKPLARFFKAVKDAIKRVFIKDTFFEDLGLVYLGPVDGHNVKKLTRVLTEAKDKHRCCVVHMTTTKGKGYAYAESEPGKYHGVGGFDAELGAEDGKSESFSTRVGDILCSLAAQDEKICAITAAMCDGTGLGGFKEAYPDRLFDVGIAEEHAITFAGGLAAAGMKPCVALYSTFSQRVYDQMLHDISLQKLPLVLLIDRAGIVAGDGVTHQGIFDYAMFSSIPGVNIYSPETYAELERVIPAAFENNELAVIRYPKGSERRNHAQLEMRESDGIAYSGDDNSDIVIVTYGRITSEAMRAAKALSVKFSVRVVKLVKIYPVDADEIITLSRGAKVVYVFEEGIRNGGVGEKLAAAYARVGSSTKVVVRAIDGYLPHGDVEALQKECGLTAECAVADILEAALR